MSRAAITLMLVCLGGNAGAADVKETFAAGGPSASGATVGSCKQLQVTVAGGGSVTLGGGAMIQTPSPGDAAMLSSAVPLPAAGYRVTVEIDGINYPMNALDGPENGSTLLAITDTPPQAQSETWWASHRIVGFEADMPGGATQQNTIFVNYWAAGVMYTWSGAQWASGDAGWLPAATHDGASLYRFTIEKAGGQYTLTMSQGGSELARAQVAVASTTPAATEYLVVGDRLTDAFNGSMRVVSITIPATCGGPAPPVGDGGVKPGNDWGNPNPPPYSDGLGGWPSTDAGSKGKMTGRPEASPCDCAVGGASEGTWSLLLLLGLLLLRSRRYKKQ